MILPHSNEKDLHELPEGFAEEMEVVFAETIGDVLAAAIADGGDS